MAGSIKLGLASSAALGNLLQLRQIPSLYNREAPTFLGFTYWGYSLTR